MRRLLLTLPTLLLAGAVAAQQVPVDLAALFPNDLDAYAEGKDLGGAITRLFGTPLLETLLAIDAEPKKEPDKGELFLQAVLPLLGRRSAVGARYDTGLFRVLIVTEDNGVDLSEAARRIRTAVPDLPEPKSDTLLDHPALAFGNAAVLCRARDCLIFANSASLARRAVRMRRDESLAAAKDFAEARTRLGSREIFVFGDLRTLFAKGRPSLENPDNFLGYLLIAGLADGLLEAERVEAGADFSSATPSAEITLWRAPRADRGFARAHRPPPCDFSALQNLVAWARIDRDLAAYWPQRLDVTPAAARPSLAEFSRNLAIFFSGFATADIVGRLTPGFDLVAIASSFEKGREPLVRYPAFALVLGATIDADFADRLRVAFQTTIGIVNASGGESGRQPMLQERLVIENREALSARFLRDPKKGFSGAEYNFTPTLWIGGSRIVLASTPDCARAVAAVPERAAAGLHGDLLVVGMPELAGVLADNADTLVDRVALAGRAERSEAKARLDAALEKLRRAPGLRIDHVDHDDRQVWRLSAAPPEKAR